VIGTASTPALVACPQAIPSEWTPHDATWLAWPHGARSWPGKSGAIPWVYAEIVRNLVAGETVRILVNDAAHEAGARRVLARAGVDLEDVELRRCRTDRVCTRDAGPIFVIRGGEKAIARFRFNAWAKYSGWRNDARIPERAAKMIGAPLLPVVHAGREVVLEGGAFDVNGRGTVLATEECLLDPEVQVRNPGFGRAHYEAVFRDALGAPNAVWLGKGIAGDDTHGHVDAVARFVGPRTIVLCREIDGSDPNHRPLEENRERLESARLEDGSRPQVAFLPMPAPVAFRGRRLPASYASFYVSNVAVLVPTFDDPNDRIALGVLAGLFHATPIIGIHALDLVSGIGTLHCVSQQEPRSARAS
jgi:agmatine deiminase